MRDIFSGVAYGLIMTVIVFIAVSCISAYNHQKESELSTRDRLIRKYRMTEQQKEWRHRLRIEEIKESK